MAGSGPTWWSRRTWAAVALAVAVAVWPAAKEFGAAGWTLMYERDGFKAYEMRGELPAYRAEGSVDLSLAEVAAVLVDVPRETEWVSYLSESRVLEGDPLSHSVIYSRYDLPWPVRDRDAVIESTVEKRPKDGEVHVRFRTASSATAPDGTGCIRVPRCEGEFTLVKEASGAVRVTYTIRLDPGGWLPNWLVRHFIREAPADTLRAFKAQVLRTRGQYDEFIRTHSAQWEREKAEP